MNIEIQFATDIAFYDFFKLRTYLMFTINKRIRSRFYVMG